jgi:long-chain acyl-CoA synthetase
MTAAEKLSVDVGGAERNLLELLASRVKENRGPAVSHKVNGAWSDLSWASVLEQVQRLSAGLVAQGVKPGDRVAIFGGTTVQWIICDLAVSASRAIGVPIYASNTPDEVRYILQNSGASLLFVDNDVGDAKQNGRISRVRSRLSECPEVQKVVLFEGTPQGDKELSLQALIDLGKSEPVSAYDERVKALGPDDLCHFIYTSGTTGDPKGVMLTQGNWAYEAQCTAKVGMMAPGDSVMLFLPLAHSFAQVIKASWLGMGFKLVFAESIDKLIPNLAETKPMVLPSVPRVFEKVFAGVQANALSAPGVKGKLARWAFRLFDEYVDARKMGREYDSLGWALAKRLVFSKVKAQLNEKLGGRLRLFISGGAPLSPKIAYFFDLLDFTVLEGFGLTETAAGTTVNRPGPGGVKIGTVGLAMPGSVVKIASDGEILIKGPGVMKGYYKNEAATKEVLEEDGWFHSGDIGEIDSQGYVRITDRKKDIIVTAGGKNVAPQNLENTLKTYPIVSSAMVYGDKRPYLTALVCVAEETAKKMLAEKGVNISSYEELAKRPEVKDAVQKAIDSLNADQPPYNTLKRFALMDHDFTQESGELTPTLKVKRKFCTQKYQSILDGLYDEKRVE